MIKRHFGAGEEDSISNAERFRQLGGGGGVASDNLLGHHCGCQVWQQGMLDAH